MIWYSSVCCAGREAGRRPISAIPAYSHIQIQLLTVSSMELLWFIPSFGHECFPSTSECRFVAVPPPTSFQLLRCPLVVSTFPNVDVWQRSLWSIPLLSSFSRAAASRHYHMEPATEWKRNTKNTNHRHREQLMNHPGTPSNRSLVCYSLIGSSTIVHSKRARSLFLLLGSGARSGPRQGTLFLLLSPR